MAIQGGYRFKVPFDDVFPDGCYVMSVERAKTYDNGKPKDAVDKDTGLPVWAVQCTDPSARGKNTGQVVKIAARVQPVPPEALPNTPFRPVIFEDMAAVPYVRDGWISYTLWASDMHSALPQGQRGKPAAGKSGESDPAAKSAAA